MKRYLLSVALAAAAGLVQAAGDPAIGKDKSAMCAACHGADGNSGMNPLWPKLAGQNPGYLVKQIKDFKSGARTDATMAPMAMAVTDEDMAHLAAYFSSQTSSPVEAQAVEVDLGQSLYRAGSATKSLSACTACHGPQGLGNPMAGFPRVSGQSAEYVAKALKDFRSGARTNDLNGMMRDVASRMSDAEIAAVANYAQGLY